MKGSKKGEITVFSIPEKSYASKMKDIVASMSSSYGRICFVSVSKPYSSALESVKKYGADPKKFFFVDCTESRVQETGQVVNVSSPKALTEMNITINKVIDLGKIEALIFDSLSTVLVYSDTSTVVKFSNSLISSLRSKKVAAALICIEGGKNAELVKDISMFADGVS